MLARATGTARPVSSNGGEATGDENATTTFLRGIQLTGENGEGEFATIYPGWYTSRTVHVHMKVHVEGAAGDAASDETAMATPEGGETHQGGHTSYVGQLFFDDALSDEVFATEASARDSEEGKLTNDKDTIFGDHGDEPGFLVALEGTVDAGLAGAITIGVDPSATAAEGGMDGGRTAGRPASGRRHAAYGCVAERPAGRHRTDRSSGDGAGARPPRLPCPDNEVVSKTAQPVEKGLARLGAETLNCLQ